MPRSERSSRRAIAISVASSRSTASGACAPPTKTRINACPFGARPGHLTLLKVAAGQMAPELLGSLNVRPAALEQAGYGFRDRDVTAVLAAGLA